MRHFNREINFLKANFKYYKIINENSYFLYYEFDETFFSKKYNIIIIHSKYKSPTCKILKCELDQVKLPKLHLHRDPYLEKVKGIKNKSKFKSTYYYPCTYVNKKGENEWSDSYTISDFIKWIEKWLIAFEYWAITGKWLGVEYEH